MPSSAAALRCTGPMNDPVPPTIIAIRTGPAAIADAALMPSFLCSIARTCK
jgi:hypothetical protein